MVRWAVSNTITACLTSQNGIPGGAPPDHTVLNENYIPVLGAEQKQFAYPEALQRLMDHTWKAGTVNLNVPRGHLLMGASSGRLAGYNANIGNDPARAAA